MKSPRGAAPPRAVASRLIAVEKEFARLCRSEKIVDEVHNFGVGEEIFKNGGVVVAAEVKGFLELGREPPVPLVHTGSTPPRSTVADARSALCKRARGGRRGRGWRYFC